MQDCCLFGPGRFRVQIAIGFALGDIVDSWESYRPNWTRLPMPSGCHAAQSENAPNPDRLERP